jgi:hypothetical protein
MADGSLHFLGYDIDYEVFRAFTNRSDSKVMDGSP